LLEKEGGGVGRGEGGRGDKQTWKFYDITKKLSFYSSSGT